MIDLVFKPPIEIFKLTTHIKAGIICLDWPQLAYFIMSYFPFLSWYHSYLLWCNISIEKLHLSCINKYNKYCTWQTKIEFRPRFLGKLINYNFVVVIVFKMNKWRQQYSCRNCRPWQFRHEEVDNVSWDRRQHGLGRRVRQLHQRQGR